MSTADGDLVRERGRFLITSDPAATDLDLVCAFLQGTYRAGGTRDAHGLYRQFGWEDAPADRYMLFTPKPPA